MEAKEIAINRIARKLPLEKQKIFFLILLERAFCSYKRHSEGKRWDYTEDLNTIIENCWDYVINGTEHDFIMNSKEIYIDQDITDKWEDELEEHSPNTIVMDDEGYDDIDPPPGNIEVLSEVVKSIYTIFDLLIKEEEFGGAPFSENFGILGELIGYRCEEELEDYGSDVNFSDYVDQHELAILEFEREKRDIEYLKKEDDLQKIYQKYHYEMNEELFGDYWFDNEYL